MPRRASTGGPGRAAEEKPQRVHAPQHGVEHCRGEVEPMVAYGVQDVLDAMGDIAHGCAAHRVRRALERVHGAEKRGDFFVLRCSRRFLESEDRPGHHLQVLRRLGSEVRDRFSVLREEALEIGDEHVGSDLIERGSGPSGIVREAGGGRGRENTERAGAS